MGFIEGRAIWRAPGFREQLDAMPEAEWIGIYREYLATLRLLDGGNDRPALGSEISLPCAPDGHNRPSRAECDLCANLPRHHRGRGSFSSLLSDSRGIGSDVSNPAGDARDCLQLLSKFSSEAEDVAGGLADRVVHMHYKALTADPMGVPRGIYDRAGLDWTPEGEEPMRRALTENRKDRHGRHVYSLGDFGLDEQQVRSACAPYEARERSLAAALNLA